MSSLYAHSHMTHLSCWYFYVTSDALDLDQPFVFIIWLSIKPTKVHFELVLSTETELKVSLCLPNWKMHRYPTVIFLGLARLRSNFYSVWVLAALVELEMFLNKRKRFWSLVCDVYVFVWVTESGRREIERERDIDWEREMMDTHR